VILAAYLLQAKGMSGATLHNTKALHFRTSTGCSGLSEKRSTEAGRFCKDKALVGPGAHCRWQEIRMRRRRATVLKTLKTGEESFNMKE